MEVLKKILIVDDDIAVTNYLMVFMMQTGEYESEVINDPREVMPALLREPFDAIILDLDMPHITGTDILKSIRDEKIEVPAIILTGVGDIDLAVKSMKLGAFDYLTKPVDEDRLLDVIRGAVKHREVHTTIKSLPEGLTRKDLSYEREFDGFPASGPSMIRILHEAEKIAASDLPVFISGGRGTGIEQLARAMHAASTRSQAPFLSIHASRHLPEDLNAVLFGRDADLSGKTTEQAGAIEAAEGGTLFINEVNALSQQAQARMLRLLHTGEYYRERSSKIRKANVRIIAASERDLAGDDYAGDFSRDLLYHLRINTVRMPPLENAADSN